MSRNERYAALAVAVVGIAYLQKFAGKEAKSLGLPVATVSVAVWLLSK